MVEAEVVEMDEDNEEELDEQEDEEEKDEEMEDLSDYDDEVSDSDHKMQAKMSGDHVSFQPVNAQHLHNSHLYKRGPTKYQKASSDYFGSNSKGHWTKEEDMALAEAVKKN